MLRNDTFSFIIKAIKRAERIKKSKIRIILAGDFSQLPPVVQKKDIKYMQKFGFDISGYAFTTSEWNTLNLKVAAKLFKEYISFLEKKVQEFLRKY